MPDLIDDVAKENVVRRYVLPECLHVPIAAADESAITNYIGDVVGVLSGKRSRRALLVKVNKPPPRDRRLPIWDLKGSSIFHKRLQVWVDVSYSRYRVAYRKAFPTEDISVQVLSHTMNRHIAALRGFQFVRLTPISRAANSSSAFSEQWGVDLLREPKATNTDARGGAFIQYADLASLMLMLDIRLGGDVMDVVNDGQKLVEPRK